MPEVKSQQVPEYILCAAIHYPDDIEHVHQPRNITTGIVVCGRRHHNIIATVADLANLKSHHVTQGFLTSRDRFVNRIEAAEIAFYAGQIETRKDSLFSEDIY